MSPRTSSFLGAVTKHFPAPHPTEPSSWLGPKHQSLFPHKTANSLLQLPAKRWVGVLRLLAVGMLSLRGQVSPRAQVRIPRGPGSSCHSGLRGWRWWVGGSREGGALGVCQWAKVPGEGRTLQKGMAVSIHPAEMTFQMHRLSSMQMRGLLHPVQFE